MSGADSPRATGNPRSRISPKTKTHECARQASEYAALLERVAVLERDLAAVQATLAAAAKPAPDPLIEQRRLSAIAQAFGGSVFVVADVLRMAAHDPELRETVTGASARERDLDPPGGRLQAETGILRTPAPFASTMRPITGSSTASPGNATSRARLTASRMTRSSVSGIHVAKGGTRKHGHGMPCCQRVPVGLRRDRTRLRGMEASVA